MFRNHPKAIAETIVQDQEIYHVQHVVINVINYDVIQ